MIDWNDLRHFLALERARTLSRAGAALKINPTTVGRRVAALEERIGARLFDRTPDGYTLTPAGRDLLPRAERMEAETLALEREIVGSDQRLVGIVRVTATEMLATRFIAPSLPAFHEDNPELSLELQCTNKRVSLGRREADIALRLARPREDNVVTRRLASIPLALYCSPAYLLRFGTPEDPNETLTGHRLILFADSRAFNIENDWLRPRLDGATIVMRSDSVSSIYSATESGLGIALLPRAVADTDPALVRIVTESEPEPRVVWQTVHGDLQRSPKIRRVLEFLARVLMPSG
jgi:DNA-binding transcriptional LysR family regulator